MSDPRYQPGIVQALRKQGHSVWQWPEELPGHGARGLGHFSRCCACGPEHPRWTFVTYGGRPFCLPCAAREKEIEC